MKNKIIVLFLCVAFLAMYTYNNIEYNPYKFMYKGLINPASELKARSENIDRNYHSEMSRLEHLNDSLKDAIINTRRVLEVSREKVTVLQKKVLLLSQQYYSAEDTSEKIIACDSLQEQVSALISESTVRDSISNATIEDLTLLTICQDSTIAVCKSSYELIKQSLDSSLSQQEVLSKQLNNAEKKLERKKRFNRWVTGGLTIASGIVAAVLIVK